ncbi:RNase H domain-containing protein [Nephila pilipes]|uniref:RNase H domain-containing protein n=1 Tax=Nephila pilipes TaxID=299642 RepID=A0A8X6PDY3_NEPPI|nr:RNase H domain-containing protein [Nephila pilipes]
MQEEICSSPSPITPSPQSLLGVFFHPTLSAHVHKTSDPPEYLRELAIELINSNIPDDAILVYTDHSGNEMSYSGSGIYIRSQDNSRQFNLRNPNGGSELITIDSALNKILSFPNSGSIRNLTDCRSTILHLSKWLRVGDNTAVANLKEPKRLSLSHEIHVQWIPLHINIAVNEIADTLAKHGAGEHPNPVLLLTYAELRFIYNSNKWSLVPPDHH